MAKKRLEVVIAGDAKGARKAFGDVSTQADGFGAKLKSVGAAVGKAMAAAGVAIAAVGVAIAVKGVAAAVEFQGSMNEVFTLLPGITGAAMAEMEGQVKDFSVEFGRLPSEVVPALYQALSAGVPKDNVFEFLEVANMAAKGGVTELTTAVDGISSVVNSYGADVITATEASDLMFTAVRLGKTNFEELSASLFQVNPVASALGVEFGDVTAALATMTAQGVPTSVATTQLRQAFVELSKDGSKTSDLFQDLSGKTFKQFVAAGGGTQDALELLAKHAKLTGLGINDLFGSTEAGSAALALTGGNAKAFSNNLDEMGGSAGATEVAFDQMNRGLGPLIDKAKAWAQVMLIDIGEKIMPHLERLGSWLSDRLPAAVDMLKGKFDQIRPTIDRVVAAFVGIGVAIMAVDWAGVFDKASEFITPVVDSVGVLATAVSDFADEAWPEMVKQFETAKPILMTIATTVRDTVTGAVDGLSGVTGFLTDHMDQLGPVLLAAAAGFAAFKTTKAVVSGFYNVVDAGKKVASTVSGATSKMSAFFQPGGGRDTVALRAMQVRDGVTKAAGALKSGAVQAAAWGKAGLVSAGNWAKATAATVANKVAQVASTAASKAAAVGQWALNAAMAANPIVLVVLVIGALIAAVVLAYQKVDWFRDGVDAMGRAVVGAFNWVKDTVVSVFNWVKDNWPLILGIITGPIGIAVSTITGYWDTIKGGFTGVKNWIGDRISDVVGFVSGMGGRISRAASGMWGGITSAFKGAINTIIRGWNAIEFRVPGFKVGPIGYSGFTLGLPDIPQLHTGGTFRAPRPGGEGLALLRDRERVLTPSQGASAQRGTTGMVQINQNLTLEIAGHVLTERKLVALVRSGFLQLQRTNSAPILPGVSG